MESDLDTIAAIATPPGEGGIAVVRISGPEAGRIARSIWRRTGGGRAGDFESHHVYHGLVVSHSDGRVIDEATLLYFGSGRSYTGDETVEIDCHGGPFVARRVLEACLEAGARPAGPGEFTRRAFMAGRMDLSQAEAVADLIASSSDRELANARMQLSGKLTERVSEIADSLVEALAEIESRLDFPDEEDLGEFPVARLRDILFSAGSELTGLASSYREGRVLREGYRLTIVGRPNVGKSSLLNRLLGAERAIVTSEAGTTRDMIEERVVWHGMPFILVDTAGIRAAVPDSAEGMAAEVSREMARRHGNDPAAGVLLVVLDASESLTSEDESVLGMIGNAPHILIFNKCDLDVELKAAELPDPWNRESPVHLSALTGDGVPALLDAVVELRGRLGDSAKSEGYLLSSARHYSAVKRSLDAIDRAIQALQSGQPPEVVAFETRLAREALDEIAGAHVTGDILDIIFSKFCIGK